MGRQPMRCASQTQRATCCGLQGKNTAHAWLAVLVLLPCSQMQARQLHPNVLQQLPTKQPTAPSTRLRRHKTPALGKRVGCIGLSLSRV